MKKSFIFASLFILPFAAVGAWAVYMMSNHVNEAIASQSWQKVPATLYQVGAYTKQSSDGDGQVHYATARFRYKYQGQQYNGNKLGIINEGGFGVWFGARVDELKSKESAGEQIFCYVDPKNPANAILAPGVVWDYLLFFAIFAITFGGFGFGGFYMFLKGVKAQAQEARQKKLYPDQPWQWRAEWQSGALSSNSRNNSKFYWFFAIFWNAISFPLLFALPSELAKENYAILIGLLFPLVGIGLLVNAIRQSIVARRFGDSTLVLSSTPALVGAKLNASLQLSSPLRPVGNVEIQLNCTKTVRRNKSTHTELLWQDNYAIPYTAQTSAAELRAIPINFTIPYHCEATDDDKNIKWKLNVTAPIAGVDFSADFNLPVFKTEQSSPEITEVEKRESSSSLFSTGIELPVNSKITYERLANGVAQINVPTMLKRRPGFAIWTIVAAVICSGVTYAISLSDAPMIFPIVFGFFAFIFALCALEYSLKTSTLLLRGDGVEVQVRRLFFSGSKTVSKSEIASIESKMDGQSQVGSRRTAHYSIRALDRDGKTRAKLVTGICDRQVANFIIAKTKETLGC